MFQELAERSGSYSDESIAIGCEVVMLEHVFHLFTRQIHQVLFQHAWKANATGRNSNSIREFREKNYNETSGQETVKLAIRALHDVVESAGKNIEVVVMTKEHGSNCQTLILPTA
nr:26S proteasome subunit alpha 4 [Ipomoea trifida]